MFRKTMDWKYQSETCHWSYVEAKTWHEKRKAAFRVAFSFSHADFFSLIWHENCSPSLLSTYILHFLARDQPDLPVPFHISPLRSLHELSVLCISATVTSLGMLMNITNLQMLKKLPLTRLFSNRIAILTYRLLWFSYINITLILQAQAYIYIYTHTPIEGDI